MEEGRFRKDLYFRIEVGLITLPSLRERRSDIPLLALYSMDNINKKLKEPKRLSQEAIKRLLQHVWPGNIRQLLNLLERTALTTRKDSLKEEDLIFRPQKSTIKLEIRLDRKSEIESRIEEMEIDLIDFHSRSGRYRIRLSKKDIETHKDFLTNLMRTAYERSTD